MENSGDSQTWNWSVGAEKSSWGCGMEWDNFSWWWMPTNRPAESLVFILAFRTHSGLLARASTVSARPVCASAGLLARRVNRSEHIYIYFFPLWQPDIVLVLMMWICFLRYFLTDFYKGKRAIKFFYYFTHLARPPRKLWLIDWYIGKKFARKPKTVV